MLSLPNPIDLWQETLDWQPTAAQQNQFQRLYDRIIDGNRYLNLTRITEPEDFWEKHLWDSLRGVKDLLQGQVEAGEAGEAGEAEKAEEAGEAGAEVMNGGFAIDIGTGAGFPGVPIAIALPHWRVTLLDATRKKVDFLKKMLVDLPIQNAVPLVGRAEAIGQQHTHREHYDLATLRAVSSAAACAEYALPLVKVGGYAVLYRGHWTDEETDQLQETVEQLGGTIESVEHFTTPITKGDRHCLYLRKVASLKTPQPIAKR
jgi:16S rRNA (guanine527-N7)-methyltransferase